MMGKLGVKTQTRRATHYNGVLNACLEVDGLNISICTTKYWGNFQPVEEPTVEIEVDGQVKITSLMRFKKILMKAIKE